MISFVNISLQIDDHVCDILMIFFIKDRTATLIMIPNFCVAVNFTYIQLTDHLNHYCTWSVMARVVRYIVYK